MKKAMILVLVLILAAGSAMACELPNIETNLTGLTGPAWWALSESHHVLGKLRETETVAVYAVQNVQGTYITGNVDTGLIREKGEMRYLEYEGHACGLTEITVAVNIRAEYTEAVRAIIERRMGNAELTAASVIACTICRTETTVTHHFFASDTDRVMVGTVIVNNGRDAVCLYMGDWNGDGLLELGFAAGYIIQQYKAPEPKPESNKTQKTETQKSCQQKSGCALVIQINAQININSTVTNTQAVNINTGCNKGRLLNCVME